jgi:hypothetical protein
VCKDAAHQFDTPGTIKLTTILKEGREHTKAK